MLCLERKPRYHSLLGRSEIMKVRHSLLYLDVQLAFCLGDKDPSFIAAFNRDDGQVAWTNLYKMGLFGGGRNK